MKKKNIISTILLVTSIIFSSYLHADEDSNDNNTDSGLSYNSVPLAPEMRETFQKGKEHGNTAGEWTKNLFCETFG